MALVPGTRFGVYEVGPLEGRGATASVYRAYDTELHRFVALKVIPGPAPGPGSPDAVARLELEARILAALDHPNIARIHGLEREGGLTALVMELVEGPTLADRLAQGALPVAEAIRVACEIALALESAHEHGVLHRDLKPSNIKYARGGAVKLIDFGLARMVPGRHGAGATATATQEGIAAGTAAYMSPEQARGHRIDQRADIWAFGCVVYELLTGTRAFPGDDAASVFAAVLSSEPDWTRIPEGVSPVALRVLQSSIEKAPADRPSHIHDVRLAFEGRFDATHGGGRGPRATTRRTPVMAAALAVMLIVLAASLRPSVPWTGAAAGTMSFDIAPPEGAQFDEATMEPYPAVSPDGRSIAYRTIGRSPTMWLQRLGDLRPRRLPATAGRPFWSPDGRVLGVATNEILQTLELSDSATPVTVCSCNSLWGASWSADDVILFANDAGLWRVSSRGGPATQVTSVSTSGGDSAHRHPLFLPDGRRFLFLVRSADPARRGVHLSSLAAPAESVRLLPHESNVALAKDQHGRDYLLSVRDLELIAHPFDLASGRLTGAPARIAPRVVPGETGRLAPFSAAGQSIVFRQTRRPHNRLRWIDRRGLALPGLDRTGHFRHVAVSGDGRALAFVQADDQTTRLDVFVHDLERDTTERLTTEPIVAFFPVWMPDHDKVVYSTTRDGPLVLKWRSRSTSDGGTLPSTPSPGTKYPTDVTRDGRHIIVTGENTVWSISVADGTSVRLASGRQGRVSPDGKWLAYMSAESGRREIYVTTFPTPAQRWRVSNQGGEDPHWRGDGRELYFLDANGTLVAAQLAYRPSFTLQRLEPLFRLTIEQDLLRFGPFFAPAPDGRRFVVVESAEPLKTSLTAVVGWTPDAMGVR